MVHVAFALALALGGPPHDACRGPLTRRAVIQCAATSPALAADREQIAAARGDASAARVLLPANPTVGVTVGGRWNTVGDRAVNVTGNLSQQIEIAGQRRKRMAEAGEEVEVRENIAAGTERNLVAAALLAYYGVVAAREEVDVISRAQATARRLGAVALARAEAGLATYVEAEVAAAEAITLAEQLSLAEGRLHVARTRLAYAVGLDPTASAPEVLGDLEPLPTAMTFERPAQAAEVRPEVAQREAEKDARAAHLQGLKRERVPSPSLSVFGMTDGFNERVIGGGLSFPLPLPFPVGRTNRGQIEAARARVREAEHRISAVRREVLLEAAVAHHEFEAYARAASAYSPETLTRARQTLQDLSEEIERGRLPVRDALLTQQALIRLLMRALEAKHQLCRASVALALAAGISFDGGDP